MVNKNNVQILAISGKLKHGKDTLTQFILTQIQHIKPDICINKVAFADPIKKMAKIMIPEITDDDLWGPSQNREKILSGYINPNTGNPLIVRDVLTSIGKWGRSTNDKCWVFATFNLVDQIIKENPNKEHLILISDCRFKNELEEIEKRNGRVIRVIRDSVGFTTNDVSEIDLDDIPINRYFYCVKNNFGLDNLYSEAQNVAKKIIYNKT